MRTEPQIETERLVLRLPQLADAAGALELLTDPVAMQYIGGVAPEVDATAVVGMWLARWEANGFGHFALERREDGRFLGRTGMIVWDTRDWRVSTADEAGDHGQPELGWALAREHWGHGYATEAARAVRDWARNELGIGHLISLIHPDNIASQRVATKLDAESTETITLSEAGVDCVVWVHP